MKPIVVLALVAGAFVIVEHADAQALTPISGEAFKQALRDQPTEVELPNRSKATLIYKADGTASFTTGTASDTGTWRPTPTGYCVTWARIRGGSEGCFDLFRNAGGEIEAYDSRTQAYTGKFLPAK
jgi:hypothetical protein